MVYGQAKYLPEDMLIDGVQKAQKEFRDYCYLGAHFVEHEGCKGVCFMVFAPNAMKLYVAGQFNAWDGKNHPMKRLRETGIWHIFICGLEELVQYKYQIIGKDGNLVHKADPYGFYSEVRPNTASICVTLDEYRWNDDQWIKRKADCQKLNERMNIYEVHFGSWRQKDNGDFYNYREIAAELITYVVSMGYTHIELLPLMEHPFDGSWGYQTTGYFSVTSRYGKPEDFMYFVDQCHQYGIGVILDWVPCHFCRDEHGLSKFDGSALYEFDDPAMSDNVQWGTLSFDHEKPATRRFLISNALFWLDIYHIDGLRVDAVSYMLYLDAGRDSNQWVPNKYGNRENLGAIRFLKKLNKVVHKCYPNTLMIAEESTAWPNVTGSPKIGGLGFDLKWNMGWMNDVLKYMEMDPIYRKWHHHSICFSFVYAASEKFVLVLSHDEVVHGKKSLLNKMPGDYESKFANLRVLLGYMIGHPGKKLLFMGGEFGQFIEWNECKQLDWMLLEYESHRQLQAYVKELNFFYKAEKALYQLDSSASGFEWIDSSNCDQSIIAFMRKAVQPDDFVIVICNFTPIARQNYRVGVPMFGEYREVFNSDLKRFGGTDTANALPIEAKALEWNNQPYCIEIVVPQLSTTFIKLNCVQGCN